MPNCDHATSKIYQIPQGRGVGAIIAWDPIQSFTHSNTADSSSVTYPAWVILAHEMGHAIQVHTSELSPTAWLTNYIANPATVEMLNITAHETPIVTNLGLAPRTSY